MIVLSRLEALEEAIRARAWDDVEFQYDRVRRATTKALAVVEAPGQ